MAVKLRAMFSLDDHYSRTIRTMTGATGSATSSILTASRSADSFNTELRNANATISITTELMRKLTGAFGGFFAIKKLVETSDEVSNMTARIDFMNDGLQTTKQLQEEIWKSAERARGSYMDMSDAVARLGLLAKDAFGSSEEVVMFTELLQKSFKVGGAGIQEQKSAMLQLSQAMAAGRLQGDEYVSIMENAPMIIDAITKHLGVSKGELKKMSSEGEITANVIKKALFEASDDINKKFEQMPKTFADHWESIKNHAIASFDAVFVKMSELANNEAFQYFVNAFNMIIMIGAEAIGGVIDLVSWLSQIIVDNWAIIEPILIAIVLYYTVQLIINLTTIAVKLATVVVGWILMHLPIIIIIALIALVIYGLMQFGVSASEIIGGVIGIFYWLGAVIFNVFALAYNTVQTFAEFFGNVFKRPAQAVGVLFNNVGIGITKVFRGVAKQIDNFLGALKIETNLAGHFDGLIDIMEDNKKQIKKDGYVDFKKLGYKDLDSALQKGFDKGKAIGDKAGDFMKGVGGFMKGGIPGGGGFDPNSFKPIDMPDMGGGGNDKPMKVATPKGKSLDVKVDKTDLKYLKDIAERDYIAKYNTTALAPNVQITFGDVRETADVNVVANRITKMLEEQILVLREG